MKNCYDELNDSNDTKVTEDSFYKLSHESFSCIAIFSDERFTARMQLFFLANCM